LQDFYTVITVYLNNDKFYEEMCIRYTRRDSRTWMLK